MHDILAAVDGEEDGVRIRQVPKGSQCALRLVCTADKKGSRRVVAGGLAFVESSRRHLRAESRKPKAANAYVRSNREIVLCPRCSTLLAARLQRRYLMRQRRVEPDLCQHGIVAFHQLVPERVRMPIEQRLQRFPGQILSRAQD